MNILIVDDDADDTDLFCTVLRDLDPLAVCTVIHGCDAISSIITSLPVQNYIFVDAYMNPVNGKECVCQLMKVIDTEITRVIIYTGSLSPTEELEFITLGVSAIVLKANQYDLLKENLRKVLRTNA